MTQRLSKALTVAGALLYGATLHAQVLEPPVYFDLPPQTGAASFATNGVPSTFQIGEVDPSVTAAGTQTPLNDLVILNSPFFDGDPSQVLRVYTIRHTSATDTRALSLETPEDFPQGDTNCLNDSSSLQLADMNGDGVNDAVFASGACARLAPPIQGIKFFGDMFSAGAFALAGSGGTGPFFSGEPIFLGEQGDGSLPQPLSYFEDASQPVIAAAPFFSSGGANDIVFYNAFFEATPVDQLRLLQNNGNLEPLPFFDRDIQGPFTPDVFNTGADIVAGDFDGDGNQDVALLFQNTTTPAAGNSRLRVYLGDGAGNFNPAPAVDANVGGAAGLHGLASGDFDGNGFADFVTTERDSTSGIFSNLYIVTCAPGSPQATCNVQEFPLMPDNQNIGISVAAGDFNSDGLDDIAVSKVFEGADVVTGSDVAVYLNQGGMFNTTPDLPLMTLTPPQTYAETVIPQVLAKDIDGCGGPDLAFIGEAFDTVPALVFDSGKFSSLDGTKNGATTAPSFQAAVAFNVNEDPVADAGQPVPEAQGVRVGGAPTCSDPTGDAMTIQWEVVSGKAAISDPTAANPLVTNGNQDAVLQVTCTDSCGASAVSTVTVNGNAAGFLEGASCALSSRTADPAGFILLGLTLLALPLWRLRRGE